MCGDEIFVVNHGLGGRNHDILHNLNCVLYWEEDKEEKIHRVYVIGMFIGSRLHGVSLFQDYCQYQHSMRKIILFDLIWNKGWYSRLNSLFEKYVDHLCFFQLKCFFLKMSVTGEQKSLKHVPCCYVIATILRNNHCYCCQSIVALFNAPLSKIYFLSKMKCENLKFVWRFFRSMHV
jgi:hypothetical protein